jgi:prepilin-type N-terminal cleavage/methylation domain-containing protein
MTRREVNPARGAFTLVELLVVIAIIAVLVSLTAAAVMRFTVKGPELQTQNDIGEMSRAVTAFQAEFNVGYIPSRLVLREQYDAGTWAAVQSPTTPALALEKASVSYLETIFGRRFKMFDPAASTPIMHDWNGDGTIDPVGTARELQGQHCLVFFLGGIPTQDGKATTGFSTSPSFPAAASAPGQARRGPYFPFRSGRLVRDLNSALGPASVNNGFLVYKDAFNKQPYAYFSSTKAGYNSWTAPAPAGLGTSDCAALGITPYVQSVTAQGIRYCNHEGFQIISAGIDGKFGAGSGLPAPGPVAAIDLANGSKDQPTMDNFTNFTPLRLGAGGG